jgi:hypothetical protein
MTVYIRESFSTWMKICVSRTVAFPLRRARRVGVALAAIALLEVSACGSDTPTDPDGVKSITLSLSTTGATIPQGGSTQLTATVTRQGGFIGPVDVTVEDAAAGISADVSNVHTSNGITTATVSVGANITATAGASSLTVRATGNGVSAAMDFAVFVTAGQMALGR